MNILIDKLPTKIKVNNKILDIDADFRNCLIIIQAFEDEELYLEEKVEILLERLYVDEILEEDIEEAYKQGIKFLDLGKQTQNEEINSKKVYSFKKDSNYIYTAINQSHHIDLNEIDFLHWWKFIYLFMDIGQECMFNQLIYYRKRKNENKLTKDEKKIYLSMRKILDLDYDEEENNDEDDEFMRKLGGDLYGKN